ncbi:hypothetical protein NQ317_002568 [Molorchus minor]|uniref:Uncharacterized protein n=1 Tax=Molorchus minor TaxID=1323400 RepID=A0ABQ9JIK4_9CUCU|nr:hypothetical protein NQ317_002568 [Molorchus minor]
MRHLHTLYPVKGCSNQAIEHVKEITDDTGNTFIHYLHGLLPNGEGISFRDKVQGKYILHLGNIWQQLLSFHFILEIVNTIPFTMTECKDNK